MIERDIYREFYEGVIATALVFGTDRNDRPLENKYTAEDIVPSAQKYIYRCGALFINIARALDLIDTNYSYSSLGIDFYCVSNAVGDNDFTDERLTAIAAQFYGFTLYETDDGSLDIDDDLYNAARMRNAKQNEVKPVETIDDLLGEL